MKHQIRKTALKILLLFVLLYIVDQTVGIIFRNISDKVLERAPNASRTAFTMKKVDADILIMGSSRANHHYVSSVISDSFNKTVFNCGLDGQSFAYSVAMIHAVLKRYAPKVIIVDISQQMLASNFSFGNLAELYPYYSDDAFYADLLIKEDANNRFKMQSQMYKYNSKFIGLVGKMIMPDYVQEKGYAALPANGYKYPEISSAVYEVDTQIDSSQVELLQDCINMCKEKNVELIFSVSPRFQQSNISQVQSFKSLEEILSVNEIPFIYMGDNSFIKDQKLYKDGAHLNHNGAIAFTKLFIQRLQERSIPLLSVH